MLVFDSNGYDRLKLFLIDEIFIETGIIKVRSIRLIVDMIYSTISITVSAIIVLFYILSYN